MYLLYFLITLTALRSVSSSNSKSDIDLCMTRDKIVPQLIHKAPKLLCRVSYQNYGKIETGAELPPNVTNVEPDVSWKARNNTIYTLYMAGMKNGEKIFTDRTTPKVKVPRSRGEIVDWEQWIVVNIPKNRACFGETFFPYLPPGLPDDPSIPELYVFLIFEQKHSIELQSLGEVKRLNKNSQLSKVLDFTVEHDLGDPIAGNYFFTRCTKPAKKRSSLHKKI